jgi:hypothetical protein
MDDLFKRTLKDIDMYSKVLRSLAERAIELGLAPKDVTVQRAHLKVDAAARAYQELEEKAKELNYVSAKSAMMALSQYKTRDKDVDISSLPTVFHRVPSIWLSGRAKTKLKSGFAPMRVRDAERQHRVMIPLLIEAWALTEGDSEVQQQIEAEYRNSSAADFERALYEYIYELEEPTLEEQLADRAATSAAEFAEWQAENARAREAREARRNRNTEEGR